MTSSPATPDNSYKQRQPKYIFFVGVATVLGALAPGVVAFSIATEEYAQESRYLAFFALFLLVVGVVAIIQYRNSYIVDAPDRIAVVGILGKEKGMRHDEIESFWCSKNRRNSMVFLTSKDVKDLCLELRPYRAPNLFHALLPIAAQSVQGKQLEKQLRLLGKICSVRVTDEHIAHAHHISAQAYNGS